MNLEVCRYNLKVKSGTFWPEIDVAFVEEVLGLKRDGDHVDLVRVNASGLSCLAYLETRPAAKAAEAAKRGGVDAVVNVQQTEPKICPDCGFRVKLMDNGQYWCLSDISCGFRGKLRASR